MLQMLHQCLKRGIAVRALGSRLPRLAAVLHRMHSISSQGRFLPYWGLDTSAKDWILRPRSGFAFDSLLHEVMARCPMLVS